MNAEPVAAVATVRALLREGTERLRAARVSDARRTALTVLGVLLDRQPGRLILAADDVVPASIPDQFSARVERLLQGEPLAYVLGTVGFRTIDLRVDGRVLIPRPETEGLVQLVLDWARARQPGGGLAADVGTGSGCIALALAVEGRFDRIIATDASRDALAVAGCNRGLIRPAVPVELRHGDLLGPLAGECLDIIVSNPPYVSQAEWRTLDAGVRVHEPEAALVSGEGGLRHIRRLLAGASRLLRSGGLMAIEIDARRADAALDLARRTGWHGCEVRRDLFDRDRYLLVTKGES